MREDCWESQGKTDKGSTQPGIREPPLTLPVEHFKIGILMGLLYSLQWEILMEGATWESMRVGRSPGLHLNKPQEQSLESSP